MKRVVFTNPISIHATREIFTRFEKSAKKVQ